MIIAIITLILVFAVMVGAPWAVLLIIKARGEQDMAVRKKINKKALYIALGPVILLFLLLSLWGFLTALLKY